MGKFAVILPAAGRSSRFGDPKQKKIYAELEGRAVWLRAVEPFINRDDVAQIIMAIAPEDRELFERRYRATVAFMNIKVIEGGPNGARRWPATGGRRSGLRPRRRARRSPAVLERTSWSKRCSRRPAHGGRTAGRAGLRNDQASRGRAIHERDVPSRRALPGPDARKLSSAACSTRHTRSGRGSEGRVTDDCQLVEALGHRCAIVESSPLNIKITTTA